MPKPTTYKKKYCQMLIDHMSEGLSFGSFGGVIDAGLSTTYEWLKNFPEFKEAYQRAKSKHMLHFEKLLNKKAAGTNRNIDLGVCIFPLKTIHHKVYGDKKEIELRQEVTVIVFVEKEGEE